MKAPHREGKIKHMGIEGMEQGSRSGTVFEVSRPPAVASSAALVNGISAVLLWPAFADSRQLHLRLDLEQLRV